MNFFEEWAFCFPLDLYMDEMATTQISKDELDELKEAFAKVGECILYHNILLEITINQPLSEKYSEIDSKNQG